MADLARPRLLAALAAALLAATLGCERGGTVPALPSPAMAPSVLAAPAPNAGGVSAAPVSAPPASAPPIAPLTAAILDAAHARLRTEASQRPQGTPTVEAVLAALEAGGLAILPGSQSLAALTEASYCWQSRAVDGAITFSVCEYRTPDAVKKSQVVSLTKFAAMGPRTFVVQGNTMMTIKVHKPGGEAAVEKAKAILARMR